MNKWSTSLPSIISLCNDVQFEFDPVFIQQTGTGTPTTTSMSSSHKNLYSGSGSLSDLSILIQSQPSFISYDEYLNNYTQSSKPPISLYDTSIEHATTIQADISSHEQFVTDDELLESLVAYADSFNLVSSDYSIQNTKLQLTTKVTPIPKVQTTPIPKIKPTPISTVQTNIRRRTQSSTANLTSMIENDALTRHRSCDDITMACSITSTSKPITVIPREELRKKKKLTKFVPSESHPQFFFARKTDENNDNHNHNNIFEKHHEEKPIEDGATTTDISKFEWGFSSDTMNESNKPLGESFHNYEATTNIGDINLNYLKDLERCSSMAASIDFTHEYSTPIPPPPPPVIIRKKSKDIILKQQVDIQLLRPPTPPPPAPIIIREVRHKPPLPPRSMTIHQKLENTGQVQLSRTPSPIVIRERPPLPPKKDYPSKPTIFYRHLPTPPPSPPTVIVERLRPRVSAVIQKPAPILVEKWLPYPPEQQREIIYERASPLPIRHKRQANEHAKKIIVEYDDVNIIVNKDVKQRSEIKCVRPDQYVQQYGNSLYSNETLNKLLTDFTCSSQVKNEQPNLSHQRYYENYSPIYH
ncbi:unnamed protein product [Rotaria sordida]|uniref:Uncharacterized protein n=1 Tax=Rotaria sordida TaxID=392033 RepID=A0A813YA71_9BILA|nr:unnamed protein product [Rotaria sordida]CAF0881319.1 unnamed protein product [Rotaria sordida]CAF3727184.1 unnamed protein product [Rotaria sordida]CAF3877828.1 unnamed protein product [Rotaria sordida]